LIVTNRQVIENFFLIDNSPNETYEYEGIDNVEYIYNGGKILDMVQRIISE